MADVATPLHIVVHNEKFVWTKEYDKAFGNLMFLWSKALLVQPPYWSKDFHVFFDALDIAIDKVLMQEYEIKWF